MNSEPRISHSRYSPPKSSAFQLSSAFPSVFSVCSVVQKLPTGFTGFNDYSTDTAYLAGMFSPFPGDVKLFDLAFPRIALVAYRVLFSKLGQNHVPFFSFRVAKEESQIQDNPSGGRAAGIAIAECH